MDALQIATDPAPPQPQPTPITATSSDTTSPFSAENAFAAAQRMAKALASSSLVPQLYRDNIANCIIAMELASRIRVSVLAAMQNLDVIQGKPSWSSKFLIATVNASGRFTPLRFEWDGKPGTDAWACRAVAKDRASGERCEGPWITWTMATKEGWTKKNGSKWLTMPELMFCYRSAAFWSRIYCPEISLGFHTSEELQDIAPHEIDASTTTMPEGLSPAGAASLEAVLGVQRTAKVIDAPSDDPPKPEQQELATDAAKGKR